MNDVVVVIGARGFGLPCARRLGRGCRLLMGDVAADVLTVARDTLRSEGYETTTRQVDIADCGSVKDFAAQVPKLGKLKTLLITAGLSPHMAPPARIYAVNMLGTINVMESFLPLAERGTVGVIIASSAAYMAPISIEVEHQLATAPPGELHEFLQQVPGWDTGLGAYWLAKRCNQLRVQSAAPVWGRRGARIVSVSPGLTSTAMVEFERNAGSPVDESIANTPMSRIGVPDDIAAAVEWLAGPQASYITGTDLLIDGGMTSALKWTAFATQDPRDRNSQVP